VRLNEERDAHDRVFARIGLKRRRRVGRRERREDAEGDPKRARVLDETSRARSEAR